MVTEEQKKFIADFYKYSFVGVMLDWIKRGMKEAPEQIANIKLILTVKVAQDPQLDFAYDTLSEKDMAIARAFYTVAIIFGLSVTTSVGLSLIGKVLEGYGLPQTPIAVFKLCKLIAS